MKKLSILLLALASFAFAGTSFAEGTEATAVVETVVAEAAPAAEAAVDPLAAMNSGDVAWMLTSTMLVILMIIPGLALFYGGLARGKNMLSVLMQVFMIFAVISLLWAIYGYSLTFGGEGKFVADLGKAFLAGITPTTMSTILANLPEFVFVAFQGTFAAITTALIVGAFAERMKFAAVMLFSVIWFTFSYIPVAHMV